MVKPEHTESIKLAEPPIEKRISEGPWAAKSHPAVFEATQQPPRLKPGSYTYE